MSIRSWLTVPAFGLLAYSAAAHAQWRCDCTSVVASCSADVAIRGSWVEISTDQQQCARVDYFIDGQPFVAVAVDGADRQDWIARSENPQVLVQSCQVCRDTAGVQPVPVPPPSAAVVTQRGPSDAAQTSLAPLIQIAPVYPSAAQARGVEGYVDVELTVNALGNVAGARVSAAQPSGVFDQAALAAVSRWRYPAAADRPAQTVKERVAFNLADAGERARAARPGIAVAVIVAGPRNQCVRENIVYNYGEMIEVGLMNACEEPLLVFGCAAGTGKYLGRWVCSDSEQQEDLLVAPGDERVGGLTAVATSAGSRSYTYAESFFVARAPNSQYWWVACAATDTSCRADARDWLRAVDRQSASVDPNDRSRIAVARSY